MSVGRQVTSWSLVQATLVIYMYVVQLPMYAWIGGLAISRGSLA